MNGGVAKWVNASIAEGQKQCQVYQWYDMCGGGCPFLKYALNGTWQGTYVHCRSRQALLRHVQHRIFVKKGEEVAA